MENENLSGEKTDEKVANLSENVSVKNDNLEEIAVPRESMVIFFSFQIIVFFKWTTVKVLIYLKKAF